MNSKSSVWIVASAAVAVAVVAGVAVALIQPSAQNPSVPQSSSSPNTMTSSPQASSTTAAAPSPSTPPPASSPSATSPSVDSPSVAAEKAPAPLREVQSCQITMAIVDDPEPPLNVRSSPTTTTNNVTGTLSNGTFVSVVKEQNGWLQIVNPVDGWIAKNRTRSGCNQKVERVRFGKGSVSATIRDRFIGTGTHQYLFNARQGQTFTLTQQEGPFPLIMAPNGKPLVEGPDDQRDRWSGSLPQTGDYTVQFDSNFRGYTYTFVVEIR